MPPLPVVSGKQAVRALTNAGFDFARQQGSHAIMKRTSPPRTIVTVPLHKQLKAGTLRSVIRASGLTVEQFIEHLK